MALIGKIREKSWLLVLIIGLALLAFILTDYQGMTGGQVEQTGYGSVFGEQIDQRLYERTSSQVQALDQQQAQQQGKEYAAKDLEASKAKAWQSIVDSVILQKELDKLGITVSEREFDAYLFGEEGFSVLPDIAQSFQGENGQFNLQLLQQRVDEMKNSTDPQQQKGWEQTKNTLTSRRQQEKYFEILNAGLYVSTLEAQDEYVAQKEKKSISYALGRYNSIKDEDIKIKDEELKAYYEEHKEDKKYEVPTAAKEVKYFTIDINPSSADSVAFDESIQQLRDKFASKNTLKKDSAFVMNNSELRFFSSGPFSTIIPDDHPQAKTLLNYPAKQDSLFQNVKEGDLVGPYRVGSEAYIAKVTGFTRDTINARHILLKAEEGKEAEVQALADSLMDIINNDNFEELVEKYSDDTGSKVKGGDLGDFFFTSMVQPFAKFVATSPIGEIGKVNSQFGIHIVQVTGTRGIPHPRVALLKKTLKPSTTTTDKKETEIHNILYDIDDEFATLNSPKEKVAAFDTIAKKNDYFSRTMQIQEENIQITGISTPYAETKILELAFSEGNEPGRLFGSPIKDENRYIIAMLSDVKKEGVPTFENAEVAMRRDLIKEKKADIMKSKLTGKSVEVAAKALNVEVGNAEVTFSSPQITGAGYEPEVVGKLFGALKDGERTIPISGNSGVYVVRVNKTDKAPVATNYDAEKQTLEAAFRSAQTTLMDGLREKANVVDNRKLVGIR